MATPEAEAPAAWFEPAAGPVYVRVGDVLDPGDVGSSANMRLRIGPEAVLDYAPGFPVLAGLDFIRVPRSAAQVRQWLHWAGAPATFLDMLVHDGAVLRVASETAVGAAAAFSDVRLVPDPPPGAGGTTEAVRLHGVAAALWEEHAADDLPTAIGRIAAARGAGAEETARRVLSAVTQVLRAGLGHLEWLSAPAPEDAMVPIPESAALLAAEAQVGYGQQGS